MILILVCVKIQPIVIHIKRKNKIPIQAIYNTSHIRLTRLNSRGRKEDREVLLNVCQELGISEDKLSLTDRGIVKLKLPKLKEAFHILSIEQGKPILPRTNFSARIHKLGTDFKGIRVSRQDIKSYLPNKTIPQIIDELDTELNQQTTDFKKVKIMLRALSKMFVESFK